MVARRGHRTQAARWLGAAEAHRQTVGIAHSLDERIIYEQTVAIARTALGDAGFAETFTNGRSAGLSDIIAEALNPVQNRLTAIGIYAEGRCFKPSKLMIE